MDIEKVCLGCFDAEVESGFCPKCGYQKDTKPDNSYQLEPSTILNGKYLIGKVIGHGEFSITYLGMDLNMHFKVAIKEYFSADLVQRNKDDSTVYTFGEDTAQNFKYGREKFLEEGRVLARFHNTPGIITVYDYFEENNTAYLAMEYLEGQDMAEHTLNHGGKLPWSELAVLISPIMQALEMVHAQGFIHRDISPDNIYITKQGVPKLLDFGAAR